MPIVSILIINEARHNGLVVSIVIYNQQ